MQISNKTDKDMIMRKKTAVAAVVMLMAVLITTAYAFPSVVTETWRSNYTKAEVADDVQPEKLEEQEEKLEEQEEPTDLILESAVIQEEQQSTQDDFATPTDIAPAFSDGVDDVNDVNDTEQEENDPISLDGPVVDIGSASVDEAEDAEEPEGVDGPDKADEPDEPDEPKDPMADTENYELMLTPDEAGELIAMPGEAESSEDDGE